MIRLTLIIFFTFILCINSLKPTIDVYYESLCPDSISFIVNSFKNFYSSPEYEKLANVNFLCFRKR